MVQPGHNKGTLSMPTLVISIDGAVIKEVQLAKERTTLGRRPYNDIVIDNLAVSGEHAVLSIVDGKVVDRKSTRLNSSHTVISYAVFCLKKKKKKKRNTT